MKLTINEDSPTKRTLTVDIPAEDIVKAENDLIKEFSKQAKIPGFRPGKAPANLIRSRYKKPLRDELLQKIGSEAYKTAITDNKEIKVHSILAVNGLEEISTESPATIVIEAEIVPAFNLPAYKDFKLEEEAVAVTDEEVEEQLQQMLKSRADYQKVDREAAKGDYVRLNYEGTLGGKPVSEITDEKIFGKQENTWEEAGEDRGVGIEAIVSGILGMKEGDKKTVTQNFAGDFRVEALRGQSVEYALEVTEVREVVIPTLDDKMAESFGVKSVEELREQVKGNILSRKNQEVAMKVREQFLEQLRGGVDFPLPEKAVEQETQQVLAGLMQQNMQRGVSEEEMKKHQEGLYESAEQTAKRNLKTDILLNRIAAEEKVEVTQEDLSQALMNEAYRAQMNPEDLVKHLKENESSMRNFRQRVLFGKTLDKAIDAVKGKSAE